MDLVHEVKAVIDVKIQFRNASKLLANLSAKSLSHAPPFSFYLFQGLVSIGRGHETEVHFRKSQVGTNAHLSDGDKEPVEPRVGLPLKQDAQLALEELGHAFLSDTRHVSKVGMPCGSKASVQELVVRIALDVQGLDPFVQRASKRVVPHLALG